MTNKNLSQLIRILLLTGLALACMGCLESQAKEETIKIGYIGPLTGDAASVGQAGLAAAEFAVLEINESGGLLGKQVELIVEDDKCTAGGGTEAMNKLVNLDQVVAISGPDCGSAAGSAIPIAQVAKTPVVIRWASVPNLTKKGDFIFRVYPSDAFQGAFVAEYAFNLLGKTKAAVLFVKNDYGQGLADVFSEKFVSLGGEIVYEDSFVQEETDLRTVLSKAKASEPDVIFFPAYRSNGVAGLKQMKELGITVPVIGGDAFDADEVIKSPDANGTLFAVAVVLNPENFKQKVLEATGKKADQITAPLAYDSIHVIANAIRTASSLDPKKIREELTQTNLEGISGKIEFDQDRDLKGAKYEMRIIQNQTTAIYEAPQ